jgi:hypothetical protein
MLGSEGAKTDFKGILQTFVLWPLFAGCWLALMCPIKFLSLYICLKIFAQASRIISIKLEFNATTETESRQKPEAAGSRGSLNRVVALFIDVKRLSACNRHSGVDETQYQKATFFSLTSCVV